MGLCQADLPGATGMLDRGQRAGTGATVVAGDGHVIGMGLGYAGCNRSDADFCDQLDTDVRLRIGILQVMDELRQVLDGIDIVVWRRRDQTDTCGGMAYLGDGGVDLVPWQLATLTWLGTLCHLDLDHIGVDQVFRGHTETARGDLFDGRACRVTVWHRLETLRFLAALTGVGFATDSVHGDGQGRVCLGGNGAE